MPDPAAVRRILGDSTSKSACPAFPRQAAPPPPPLHDGPTVVWFRGHDLRIHDHTALEAAVSANKPVVALYILERGAETDGVSSYMRRLGTVSASSSHLDASQPPSRSQPPSPLSPNGGFAIGRVQRWYLHHSLRVLRDQLETLGITLILRRVDCAEDTAPIVSEVARALGAARVFWNKRYKPRAYPVEDAVRSELTAMDVVYHDFFSETLLPPNYTGQSRYDDFQTYTRFWIDTMREHPPPRPRPPLDRSQVNSLPLHQIQALLMMCSPHSAVEGSSTTYFSSDQPMPGPFSPVRTPLGHITDLELLQGLSVEGDDSPGDVSAIGCVAAERAIAAFLKDDRFARFSSAPARRDGMVTGKDLATSRLSPHVRFGEISPRALFYAVVDAGAQAKVKGNSRGLEASRTFLKNMSLREFGYYMLGRYPHAACKPIMPEFEVFPWVYDNDGMIAKAWETGNTGFPIVDAAMRQLLREGWIHNRMRFLAASFFCKYLLLPWPVGAAHMVRTLVDGDEACNSLGWQWTAGCNSDSFPFSTLVNPMSLHTQSTKVAAAYVRKYVPELAGLPDSLVFTPWKVTAEESRLYKFGLLPLDEYRTINPHWDQASSSARRICNLYLYPNRIVNGPEARTRARHAMEVMRRIFSAQRQCRTIIVDQTSVPGGKLRVTERQMLTIESSKLIEDAIFLDHSEDELSTVTGYNPVGEKNLGRNARVAGNDMVSLMQPPRKKQRVEGGQALNPNLKITCGEVTDVMSTSRTGSTISRGEVDLLLSSSGVTEKRTKRRPRHPNAEVLVAEERLGDGSSYGSQNMSSGTMKKTRPSPEGTPLAADGRVSVQALLTPTVLDPTKTVTSRRQFPPQSPTSFPNLQNSPNVSHFAGTTAYQPHGMRAPDAHPHVSHSVSPSMHAPSQGRIYQSFQNPLSDVAVEHVQKAVSPRINEPSIPTYNPIMDRPAQQFRPAPVQHVRRNGDSHATPIHQDAVNTRHEVQQSETSSRRRAHTIGVGSASNFHRGQLKERSPYQPPSFDNTRVPAAPIYQQGVAGMPVMANHYPGNHPHKAQMVLPFRAAGPVPVAPLGPQTSALHSQDGSRGYFHTVPPHLNTQPAGPMIFYPGLPQYIDMRVPQMMHPMVTSHPGALSMGYPGQNGNGLGAGSTNSRGVDHIGNQRNLAGVDRGVQSGPKNPMEREEIARRMAAMNYYDDAYGGKHWEQWQAIALHLLDQYEFSEDTNRHTTKAYVRLCVLKDELRDANPAGPRVTVNHCKEVFRILQLPVTGEWDRRGHGGVRGPYCYGCVKRSGVQSSKK
ncbi:deoxyribodipyrimidine photolyase [Chondrus crispus]|uniref:Deoxyribodipyrimidine photolyase n=1 Tax=Chondrus crispus TaxID=2769 RepID=R7Q9J2_CHOCR|nr:deoxyribodipyrimidine photolyase [Chondrus crispus]CDF35207.1 deoxyribodipyrimidine photolyase [Chondrus crispus]|eukprot:XP_005715026.1 deoxyribodipyrimidine photolyase [Chondrus crispus]